MGRRYSRRYKSYDEFDKGKATIIALSLLILLCLIAIVGLTYALFKKNGDDGKIGINVTTGKVQVDIVDAEQRSLIGDVLDFVTSDEKETVYFQPGALYYTEGFTVKNIGNIPVNFRLYISEDKAIDKKKFEEAFELYITTDPEDLETAEKLTAFSGRLETEQNSQTFYLVIKMKETAGNEFQNKTYTGIGVTVYAVQGNAEIEE